MGRLVRLPKQSLRLSWRSGVVFFAMSISVAASVSFPRDAAGQAPAAQSLLFTDKVRLLTCEPASSNPCFRLKFKIVDAQGGPSSVALPTQGHLAENLTVHVDGSTVNPFIAVASTETQSQASSRIALILVDISGSMIKPLPTGESRFEAARAALSYFLEGFEEGVDRVAIVPFESHRVVATIRSARFATTRSEAHRHVDSLPVPNNNNNTALYSAVDEGLDLLQSQLRGAQGAEALLFVLTDGENDVQPQSGDDSGLLAGSAGLEKVVNKVRAFSGIRVTAVGIGDPREVNQGDLKRIANRFKMVTDTEGLKREFEHPAAVPLSSSVQATFSSPWRDRASLAAKTLHLRVSLQLPTGEKLESSEITWSTPEMGLPLFEGKCEEREGDALLRSAAVQASAAGWTSVLRPVLVFAGLGSVLLILWFWVPRLVWADRYVGSLQPQARWAGGPSGPRPSGAPAGKPAPPGFEQGRAGVRVPQRAPGDQTTVMPINMMGTRTRLELKVPPEKERGK